MCALRAHINKSIFGKVLLGIKKVVKTFSIPNKLFPKLVYYCVPQGHTLVKSFIYLFMSIIFLTNLLDLTRPNLLILKNKNKKNKEKRKLDGNSNLTDLVFISSLIS